MALQIIDNIISNLDEQKSKPTIHDRFAVKKLSIDGLCAAVMTPFNKMKELNHSAVAQQAAYLYKTGVKAVFVGGTTGESVSLTINERKQLLKEWMNVAPKYRLTVIFHVGCNCLIDACDLAIYAESIGVDGVAVMPPSFFKPQNVESLVLSVKEIADSVPLLPIYYYNIPSMTNVQLSMYKFFIAADEIIPNLVGMNNIGMDENVSFSELQKIIKYKNGERYEVITGKDEMILQCLSAGVSGFIGSQYNFGGLLYNAIIKAYNKGNIKKAQDLSFEVIKLADLQRNGIGTNKFVAKYIMNLVGVQVGEPRLPFLSLTQKERETIQNGLQIWCEENNNAFIKLKM